MQEGNALQLLGRVREALQVSEGALALAERAGDVLGQVYTLENCAYIHTYCGDMARGQECLQRARALAEQVGSPATLQDMIALCAWSALLLGDWEQARQRLVGSCDWTVQALEGQSFSPFFLGMVCHLQGEYAEAARLLWAVDRG